MPRHTHNRPSKSQRRRNAKAKQAADERLRKRREQRQQGHRRTEKAAERVKRDAKNARREAGRLGTSDQSRW